MNTRGQLLFLDSEPLLCTPIHVFPWRILHELQGQKPWECGHGHSGSKNGKTVKRNVWEEENEKTTIEPSQASRNIIHKMISELTQEEPEQNIHFSVKWKVCTGHVYKVHLQLYHCRIPSVLRDTLCRNPDTHTFSFSYTVVLFPSFPPIPHSISGHTARGFHLRGSHSQAPNMKRRQVENPK